MCHFGPKLMAKRDAFDPKVRRCKLTVSKPVLKAPGTKRLKL